MAELRAIDGGKKDRAKALAQARVLECSCGSRRVRDEYVGRLIGKNGRIVHKGAVIMVCGQCGKQFDT